MHAGTGNDQIPDAGKAAKRLHLTAHGYTQPGNLRNPSCNKRRLRIITISQAIRNTGSQRHHVLQSCPQFNPCHIRAGIDTKYLAHKKTLNIFRSLSVIRAHHNGGGEPLAHFFRMGRAGHHSHLRLWNLFFDHL